MPPLSRGRGGGLRALCAIAVASLTFACDDDPSGVSQVVPTITIVTTDTIGQQEALRVVFNTPVNPQTALDPANFVVINECNGLRVPGSLRLIGDTLIFSPSQAIPFLTPLSVRIQNILSVDGIALSAPVTFRVITERPPVGDVSWAFLNSPTNDNITGISFATRDLGYLVTAGGAVFRTTNGGLVFGARFKDVAVASTAAIRAPTVDTVYMVGSILINSVVRRALFRSVNGGIRFDTVRTVPQIVTTLSVERGASNRITALFGGQFGAPAVYRYVEGTGAFTQASGLPTGTSFAISDVALSKNAANAVVTFRGVGVSAGTAQAFRSTDGGLTFTQITLPAGTFGLRGSGFVNNTVALLLGDSSVVVRVDAVTGVATRITQGVPQTTSGPGGAVTTFSFNRAYFEPGGQIGWIVGRTVRRQPGVPDVTGGVILISRDAGLTWTRQAISGAPNSGLDFAPVNDVHALAPDFATLGGNNGLVAARKSDVQTGATACSFTEP
ncbi:MAG: hypothetical protein ABR543_17085 [Gemmatimonadaceae bacterium]